MAIKFYNIRSKEIRVAETEPMIAAMYNSSDKGPNALVGQDFGWRLAPEVVVQMRRIIVDPEKIQDIANRFRKPFDEVGETDILKFISDTTSLKDTPVAIEGDYEEEYRSEIRDMEGQDKKAKFAPPLDTRLEDAFNEADELGIDVTGYGTNLGLIRGAITKAKKALQPIDNA